MTKKLVYIKSNHGKTRNYVDKFTGAMATFGPKENAKAFDETTANHLAALLSKSVGESFTEDDDRVSSTN